MPSLKQHGGGLLGHLHLVATDGTVWDSSPQDHLAVLDAQPFGPLLARREAAKKAIAEKIAKAMEGYLEVEKIFLVIDWSTGEAAIRID